MFRFIISSVKVDLGSDLLLIVRVNNLIQVIRLRLHCISVFRMMWSQKKPLAVVEISMRCYEAVV